MRPSQITQVLESLHKVHTPIWIHGSPGTAKSAIVRQYAEKHGECRDLRMALLESVDLRGLPKIEDEFAVWLPPNFLPHSGTGILFLDELPQAPVAVQNAALQLTLDRKLGDYQLPDGWKIIAAGNRVEDRAGVNRVTSALNLRFLHLDLDVSVEDWVEWAMAEDVNSDVVSFINFRGAPALYSFEPAERSSPNPRSWVFVSDALKTNLPEELVLPVVTGYVGKMAGEFVAHRRLAQKLPDAMEMLNTAKTCKIPKEPSVIHAMIGRLLECYRNSDGKQEVSNNLFALLDRFEPEYGYVGFLGASQIRKEAVHHPTCRAWYDRNEALMRKSKR